MFWKKWSIAMSHVPPPSHTFSTSFLGELVWCRGNKWFMHFQYVPQKRSGNLRKGGDHGTPPFSCISSFWDCFARFEVGSICIWFPTSRKITPIIFCLKSFLENIDIDNFFVRNGGWPESARKSRKRQNINRVPIVTHAENASKLPKNTEKIRKQSYQ